MNTGPAWHAALCFAVSGVRFEDLGRQPAPDVDQVRNLLIERIPDCEHTIRDAAAQRRSSGLRWPYPVPADLAEGIGPAQWSAALSELRRRLGLSHVDRPVVQQKSTRPDRDDLRLLADRPPHHGTP